MSPWGDQTMVFEGDRSYTECLSAFIFSSYPTNALARLYTLHQFTSDKSIPRYEFHEPIYPPSAPMSVNVLPFTLMIPRVRITGSNFCQV